MMRYSTYKKWEPMIEEYIRQGGGSKLAFCQKHGISHYQFCSVMRSVRYGLIEPEKLTDVSADLQKASLPEPTHLQFLKVVVLS